MAGPLIDPDELAGLLGSVVVLDVRYRLGGPDGRPDHAAGHVPGAAYVDLGTDLADPPHSFPGAGRHPLPDPARFGAAMRRAGVDRERPVVAYDDWSGRAAARAWWLLRHHGHPDVRVLDGGWPAWTAAGHRVETGPTSPSPGDFAPATTPATPVVDDAGAAAAAVLVDARESARFRGAEEPVDPVAGRVPGAVNVPTSANLDDTGRFLPAEELRQRYAAVGAVAGADVAAYCGSGITACHDLLALEVAGVRGALYPGSWSGWVDDSSRPVERG